MPNNSFNTKELLNRMDVLHEADRQRHEKVMKELSLVTSCVRETNGKVRLHQKLLWALGGGLLTLTVLFINHLGGV